MTILREVSEEPKEGLLALLGEKIVLFCANYIYTGKLVGVNDSCVKLEGAMIVYVTGDFKAKSWSDAQALPTAIWYVARPLIESFGVSNKGALDVGVAK